MGSKAMWEEFLEIYRIANVNHRVRFKGYPELSSPIISLEIVPTRESMEKLL